MPRPLRRSIRVHQVSKGKDVWDRLAIIGQLTSSVFLGVVGLSFTASNSAAQRDVANRQVANDYLNKLTISLAKPGGRKDLLDVLDVALEPKYSVPFAVRFTRPVQLRAEICGNKVYDDDLSKREADAINREALVLLRRLRAQETKEFCSIKELGQHPESDLADYVITGHQHVLFRLSNIDDVATFYINNKRIGDYKYGSDGEWIDITSQLVPSQNNTLSVVVTNSIYEGTSVRFEALVGAERYDRTIHRGDWNGEGPAFTVGLSLSVDREGLFHLNNDNVQGLGPIGEQHCSPPATVTSE